ncbi:DUF3900 domain-containing protein [Paenibacillus radicis (ex Gao et al. 2016)]|uniref:DUF3898 domain-containing protein n=1 Tax=Paenibacillus radicis (ex Gao et al. 2016) TaxID=1737354 RepID=A0A917HIL2_9BACL|nr:DUF3900 domain-containing protein [Paenibacillus radicis (ex Gao et al. 2016)]GGG79827.1 hypothetical protein GCM10010918_41160 [Paenibacillus radicis (ex Gao et al. 2016)]
MDFNMEYLSFFVIVTDGDDSGSSKRYKHYQTLDEDDYEDSEIKKFLDGEFKRIVKRKVERNPNSENAPTKIGRFMVEPGYELGSNQNYNLFQRLRDAEHKERFIGIADELVHIYMDTSAVRGGAFIIARAKLNTYFDEPFLFLLKCDFEPNIARIADERSLISQVEMAISARSIKSIQYPHMPEEGMLEHWELKIHQASHARYFEDFLKYVSYEKPLPEVMGEQVLGMVQQYMEDKWQDAPESTERREEENAIEVWANSEKRDIQEYWTHEQVAAASAALVEQKPDLSFSFKLDSVTMKGLLADFGTAFHFAKHNGRYVVVIEGDSFQFDKGMSPVELLSPPDLTDILDEIGTHRREREEAPQPQSELEASLNRAQSDNAAHNETSSNDDVPW